MKKGKGRGAKVLTTSDKKRTENIMANTNKNKLINRTDSLPIKMMEDTPAVKDFVIDSQKMHDQIPVTQSTTTKVTVTSESQIKISNNESKENTPCESKSNEPEVSKPSKEEVKLDNQSSEQSTPNSNYQNNNHQNTPHVKKIEEETERNRDVNDTAEDSSSKPLQNSDNKLNFVPHLETNYVDNSAYLIKEQNIKETVTSGINHYLK
jgi:hypothetical protein